ncbi:MAG: aspartate aminotransferase family protein [Phycisphaeraceae bacterium]|nr:aspartate aminotransferase family protein [Phycisphaerae bacterium]MBX3393530.1 aspartate aminotransferase family protein [Phycisphaeraceae bacterium]
MGTHVEASRSAALYERALDVLPGGVSRNAALHDPHPLYVDRAQGCRLTDADGVTRIDFANNMASLVHGHADPDVARVVTDQLRRGTAFSVATEIEIRCAEHLRSRNPGFEKMRFVNSGTEAVMAGIKVARAVTGRPMIAKAEGAYHGAYDSIEVSQAPTPANWGSPDEPSKVPLVRGTPRSVMDEVVVFPFNDIDRTIALLDRAKDKLACVVIDLMPHRIGLNPADPAYVSALRDWTIRHGVLLLIDEVITFRSCHGGLQQQYGVTPDLTALGKMIGGGFPIGAIAGRAEFMDVLNPRSPRYVYPHSGTFSANPVSVGAGLAAMEKFDRSASDRLNALTRLAITKIEDAIRQAGVAASVTGTGSMFRVHLKATPPRDYREAYLSPEENSRLKALLSHMLDEGIILINSCSAALSTPMTQDEVDALVAAFRSGFKRIAAMR